MREPKFVKPKKLLRYRVRDWYRTRRQKQKEIRTPQNPVKVCFVCYAGGTSGLSAEELKKQLRERKINSIKVIHRGIDAYHPEELRGTISSLQGIDFFIFMQNVPKELLGKIAENNPESIFLDYHFFNYFVPNPVKLLAKIREKFELKED